MTNYEVLYIISPSVTEEAREAILNNKFEEYKNNFLKTYYQTETSKLTNQNNYDKTQTLFERENIMKNNQLTTTTTTTKSIITIDCFSIV